MCAEEENCILFGRSLLLTLLASINLCNINSSIGIDGAPIPPFILNHNYCVTQKGFCLASQDRISCEQFCRLSEFNCDLYCCESCTFWAANKRPNVKAIKPVKGV